MVYEDNYKWKFGGMPVAASVAGKEMKRIQKEQGEITPENLLDASRDENAPLHNCFEWDDGVAAEKYRREQAHYIIRNIIVKVQTAESSTFTRAFVNVEEVKPKISGSFISLDVAMNDENMRRRVLKNALAELMSFKRKYAVYSELSTVFAAIDEFQESQNTTEDSQI